MTVVGGAWRDGKDGAWASLGGLKPKKAEAASTKRGRDVAQQAVLGPGICWLSLAGWPNKTFKVARLSAQEAWHAAMPHGWLVPDLRAARAFHFRVCHTVTPCFPLGIGLGRRHPQDWLSTVLK